jgi:filamentous hemagglutinin family protein
MCGFFKQQRRRLLWLTGSLHLYFLSTVNTVRGLSIIPDETLPNKTRVTVNGNTFLIEQGTRAGNNLFQSFLEFSVPTGSVAFFNNALDIQNIFGRVTGGNISTIDGTISANGTANLFLINPNGIIFGPNAQLNIGGSFVGSTAHSLKFSDGSEFSAKNPQASPLLTVSVLIGLQFGSNPGTIVNQSRSGNAGLQVLPGQTLALLGGDVRLEGGNLTALQGRIELGSVASEGLVTLTPTPTGLALGYEGIQNLGSVNLSGGAAVNASGLGGGTIQVRGGQVALSQGSRLVAETFGSFNGTGIDIQASQLSLKEGAFISTSTFGSGKGGNLTIRANTVELTGTTPFVTSQQLLAGTFNPLNLSDGLYSFSAGSGTAGNITIDTGQLRMRNGANLFNSAFLGGNGGDLTIRASELAEFSDGSLVFTGTAGGGNAGNIAIAAQQLRLLNGSSISTTPGPTSTGKGGNLTVTADSVELLGTPAGVAVPGGLFTTTLGDGAAGELKVTTGRLVATGGTQISTSTSGAGDGGDLTLTADTVELSDASADGRFLGGLFASASLLTVTGRPGDARAGTFTVNTRRLSVQNGAQITAATGNTQAAEKSNTINASESIDVSGFATGIDPSVKAVAFGFIDGVVPSAIETNTRGAGNAGNLTIHTGRLTVRDRAEVGVRSTGSGAAGNLDVTADSIQVENRGKISATSLLGEGGNITLNVRDDLVVRKDSEISTRAGTPDSGGGNGGNITIDTGVLAVLEKSNINANAFQGAGGNIRIATRGIFVSPDSFISASSTLGVSGVVDIDRLGIDPSQGIVELPENFSDSSKQVSTGCTADTGSSFVVTGRGGLPEDPTGILRGRALWQDVRTLSESRLEGAQRRVNSPQAQTRLNSPVQGSVRRITDNRPLVEATGWVINADGRVELVVQVPEGAASGAWHNRPDCHTLNSN